MGILQAEIKSFDIFIFNLSQFKKYGILQFNSLAYGLRWSTKSRDLVQTYICAVWIGWSGLGLLDSTVFSDSLHSWTGLAFAAMLTVPPWPMYRQKPLNWQKARPENDSGESKSK